MANYLCIFPAPDSHIDFINENPGTLWGYIEGKPPSIPETPVKQPSLWQRLTGNLPEPPLPAVIPNDWPTSEVNMIGPEINHRNVDLYHRNVDLYHWILNGTTDFVTGAGAIFQTWLESGTSRKHSAIDIGGDNEDFAFYSDQLPALLKLVSSVDEKKVQQHYTEWLNANGEDYTPTTEECSEMADEFSQFAEEIRKAIDNSQGLIWVSS